MSVYESLHCIDARALQDWMDRARTEGTDACTTHAVALARAHPREDVRQCLDDHLDDDDETHVGDIGELLMLMCAQGTWGLGNMLGTDAQELDSALGLVPALHDVVRALDRPHQDLGRLRKVASGLRVMADAPLAATLLPALNAWSDRARVKEQLRAVSVPWLARLSGRARHLEAWTARDSTWERWMTFVEAIRITAATPGALLVRQAEV